MSYADRPTLRERLNDARADAVSLLFVAGCCALWAVCSWLIGEPGGMES